MRQYLFPALMKFWQFLQSPRLLFFVLLYFMGLLVIGTLAQKYIGLFSATHLFFNSFVYWIGPVPVPVGASVLLLLFINLTAHFITSSKWSKPYIGSTLAHLSILVLLLGGGLTLMTKQEGFMLLRQDRIVDRAFDYHIREIAFYQNDKEIAVLTANDLTEEQTLALPVDVPFKVTVQSICKNCALDKDGILQARDVSLEDEVNQWGFEFNIQTANTSRVIALTEFMPPQKIDAVAPYFIAVRRHSWALPFSLRLEHFTPTYYTGTDIAQSYESAVHVVENNQKNSWPALISMNDPLRYKGYTFYQSSFLTLPDNEVASVLNVVDNAGWLFPYLATALLFLGLLVHLRVRRHAPN